MAASSLATGIPVYKVHDVVRLTQSIGRDFVKETIVEITGVGNTPMIDGISTRNNPRNVTTYTPPLDEPATKVYSVEKIDDTPTRHIVPIAFTTAIPHNRLAMRKTDLQASKTRYNARDLVYLLNNLEEGAARDGKVRYECDKWGADLSSVRKGTRCIILDITHHKKSAAYETI
ncbi:hypothetical protein K474DRAFT_1714153 [Panus rudis PR-1116 ss-1]|nr:hypothetical protein K474DRAFT_1714153 [Panus rudis PR-1116 ss-1]